MFNIPGLSTARGTLRLALLGLVGVGQESLHWRSPRSVARTLLSLDLVVVIVVVQGCVSNLLLLYRLKALVML
jgi:hypothetical protein